MRPELYSLALSAMISTAPSAATDFAEECVVGISPAPQFSGLLDKGSYVRSLCSCADGKVPELEKEVYVLLAKLSRLRPDSTEYQQFSARLESLGNQEELDRRAASRISSALATCSAELQEPIGN